MILTNLFGWLRKGFFNARGTADSVLGRNGHNDRLLHSIPTIRKQAISDFRHIGMLATACAAERGRDPGEMSADQVRQESHALLVAAKKTGCFLEAASIPGTRYTIQTGESEVHLDQREQIYYKIKNPFAKLHLKCHSAKYTLFEHCIHNIVFPDCRLDFLGVTDDCHEARLVFSQKAVRSDARPDSRQIAKVLRGIGLVPEERYRFGNGWLFVTDVEQDGDNVLLDDDGNLRFIDPIIGLKEQMITLLDGILTALSNDQNTGKSSLEFQIEALVYRIYGLTDEEIAAVEDEE